MHEGQKSEDELPAARRPAVGGLVLQLQLFPDGGDAAADDGCMHMDIPRRASSADDELQSVTHTGPQ